jgi:hypothetical protein
MSQVIVNVIEPNKKVQVTVNNASKKTLVTVTKNSSSVGRITISATQPANPSVNDIWIQI